MSNDAQIRKRASELIQSGKKKQAVQLLSQSGLFAEANKLKNELEDEMIREYGSNRRDDIVRLNQINNANQDDELIDEPDLANQEDIIESDEPEEPVGNAVEDKSNTNTGQEQADNLEREALKEGRIDQNKGENLPGGKAIDSKTPKPAQTKDPKSDKTSGGAGSQTPKEKVADQAKEWAKKKVEAAKQKAKDEIKKRFNKQVLGLLLKNPYFWAAVGIVLAILIGLIIIISLSNRSGSGVTGQTPAQVSKPIEMKDWLKRLLVYAGDSDTWKNISSDMKSGLRKSFTEMSTDSQIDPADQKAALALIDKLDQLPNADAAAAIKKGFTDLLAKYSPCTAVSLDTSGFFKFVAFTNDAEKRDLIDGRVARLKNEGGETDINPQVCSFLLWVENNKEKIGIDSLKVTCIASQHRKTTSSGNISQHWIGQAVDIDKSEASKLMPYVYDHIKDINGSGISIHQMIGPDAYPDLDKYWIQDNVKWPGATTFFDAALHFGFKNK